MSKRFNYTDDSFGPRVRDMKTGRWMGVDLVKEMASVIPIELWCQPLAALSHPDTQAGALQAVDEMDAFFAHWVSDAPADFRELAAKTAKQDLLAGRATKQLAYAWSAWQARAALAATQPNAAPGDGQGMVAWRNKADPGSTLRVQPYRPDCPGDWEQTAYVAPSTATAAREQEGSDLIEAARFAADVLAEIYAKYQRKIGPFASQAQVANVRLGAALASRSEAPAAPSAEGQVECQYSKDVWMFPEHRCVGKCQYATEDTGKNTPSARPVARIKFVKGKSVPQIQWLPDVDVHDGAYLVELPIFENQPGGPSPLKK